MIGWKCDYGYSNNNDIVNNFVKTDSGYFGFANALSLVANATNLVFSDQGSGSTAYPNRVQSGGEFAEFLLSAMGEEYYKIFTTPSSSNFNKTYLQLAQVAIAGSGTMCPNLTELWLSSKPIYSVIKIPSLSVYIALTASSTRHVIVLDSLGNRIMDDAGAFCNDVGGWMSNFIVYKGTNSEKDIKDVANYLAVGFNSGANRYTISSFSGTSNPTSKFISSLFSISYSPPDWNTPTNPYEPGGSSGEGGGGGTFDDESDPITIPPLPTLSSANTGFTRIYNPTLSQVQDLARYLWTDDSVIETIWNHIKQFFENPMDAIIGFNLVPVPVPDGGTQSFKLMYIDTGVNMTVAANQFVDIDCGTLEVKEYYGSALDYSPYTKISCFLPFIGNVSLNVDEVMSRTLQIKYRVDICSGSCVAYILVDGNAIYQYSGHCAIPIPLAAADFSSYVNASISIAKLAAAGLVAGAGAAAAVGAADAAQQTNQVVTTTQVTNTARNPVTGRQITTGTMTRVETREAPVDQSSTQASFAGLTPENISNTVGAIMSSKPHIEHSGSFSGNSGYLGVRRPFIIIERPNMCMPENYQVLNGFPSMITLELSTCTGFTRVQQVQLTGVEATNPEQAEILELLKAGVIF